MIKSYSMNIVQVALCEIAAICLLCAGLMAFPKKPQRSGYSSCYKCGTPWDKVEGHSTWYEWTEPGMMHMLAGGLDIPVAVIDGFPEEMAEFFSKPQPTRGCFPLCENCWQALKTPKARLPYYRQWMDTCGVDAQTKRETWPKLEKAVLAGF